MRQAIRAAVVLGLFVTAGAATATAQSRVWNVCGGSTFNTCASVSLNVVGQSVTLRMWNLSGFYGSATGTIFAALGFDNVGTAQGVVGSLGMSGPTRGADDPQQWILENYGVGAVRLDMVAATGSGTDNGIANDCSTLPGPPPRLWINPCQLPNGDGDPGWITLTFQIEGEWDVAGTNLTVHGINGAGQRTDCITGGPNMNCEVVPEPLTIALLGTGLAGLGGAGLLRRRRKDQDAAS